MIVLGPHPLKATLGISSDERWRPFRNYIFYWYNCAHAKARWKDHPGIRSASGIAESTAGVGTAALQANDVPKNAERISSFFNFQDNIMEAAQSFNLQYERVGKLEIVQHRAQRINIAHGRSIHGIDYVSRERPFTYERSF